jgi:hypothetical protein
LNKGDDGIPFSERVIVPQKVSYFFRIRLFLYILWFQDQVRGRTDIARAGHGDKKTFSMTSQEMIRKNIPEKGEY